MDVCYATHDQEWDFRKGELRHKPLQTFVETLTVMQEPTEERDFPDVQEMIPFAYKPTSAPRTQLNENQEYSRGSISTNLLC